MISVAVPPAPNRITGPNRRSSDTPSRSSCAFGHTIIGCTVKPGAERLAALSPRACHRLGRARASAAEASPRWTPPTSDLCVMSSDSTLMATFGACLSCSNAICSTSSGEAAMLVGTVGMP